MAAEIGKFMAAEIGNLWLLKSEVHGWNQVDFQAENGWGFRLKTGGDSG